MLSWEEFVELRNLYERGWSISAIARHLGKDRKTVRRYLTDPQARPGVRKPAGRLLDGYAAYVAARLEDNPHLAATVLGRELGELGFAGSYRTLARHLTDVRPDCVACHGPEPAESVVMRHRPGAAQADWSPFFWTPAGSTVEVEVQLFAIQLCRPKVVYAEFFERQSWAHLAAGHLAAFDYFGGVPTEVRYDRTAQVFRPRSTEPTPAFADFAGYYGFKLVPCVAGRARSKGQIERAFRYVATSFFPTADAATLAELNRTLRRWLDEVANTRTSAEVPVAPVAALQAEQPYLLAVRRPPYRLELVVARKVDRYCLVRLDGARYSVEPGHVGAEVAVVTRPGDPWVQIRRGGRVIGQHPRIGRGQVSFDPAHGAAVEALTLASLGRGGRHRRKRNDARLGPKAAEEAAILRARAALGDDGVVQPVDLARYDQLWQQP
jgi:transposase